MFFLTVLKCKCSNVQYRHETELIHGFISEIEDLEKKVLDPSLIPDNIITTSYYNEEKLAVLYRRISNTPQGSQNMFNQLHVHISLTFMVMEIMMVSSMYCISFLRPVHSNLL
jgi:hypothetical protein